MHARISWGKVDAANWDEFEQQFDRTVSQVGKIDGLRARLLLRDADVPDGAFTLSIWENEKAMRDYENSDFMQSKIIPMLRDYFSGTYKTSHCEVKYMEFWRD